MSRRYQAAAGTASASLVLVCVVFGLWAYRARRRMRQSLLLGPLTRSEKFADVSEMAMVVWLPKIAEPVRLEEHFASVLAGMRSAGQLSKASLSSAKSASSMSADPLLSGGGLMSGASPGGGQEDERFSAQISDLLTGQPQDAALGVMHYMGVTNAQELLLQMGRGLAAIRAEFDALLARANAHVLDVASSSDPEVQQRAVAARDAAQEAHECMRYVLDERAGSSPKLFRNAPAPRDCDEEGHVRADRRGPDGLGMLLEDFLALPATRTAMLELPHLACIRIYTTAAYRVINEPLRARANGNAGRTDRRASAPSAPAAPHPLPVTVSFLTAALGKLRAVGAKEDAVAQLDLWRGMRDVAVPEAFMQHGGTELAPMSTTTSLQMALQYALSGCPLLFKVKTDSFMVRGVDIECFSVFPGESEVLYPPLTYLRATGKGETIVVDGCELRVVEVIPHFGSS